MKAVQFIIQQIFEDNLPVIDWLTSSSTKLDYETIDEYSHAFPKEWGISGLRADNKTKVEFDKTCSYCDGSGEVTCPNCGGDGKEKCTNCNNGRVECSECGGEGKKECPDCYGSGTVEKWHQVEKCENCYGDGEIKCEECYGEGEVDCSDCDGTGSITCSKCSGDGTISCRDCDHGYTTGYIFVDKAWENEFKKFVIYMENTL